MSVPGVEDLPSLMGDAAGVDAAGVSALLRDARRGAKGREGGGRTGAGAFASAHGAATVTEGRDWEIGLGLSVERVAAMHDSGGIVGAGSVERAGKVDVVGRMRTGVGDATDDGIEESTWRDDGLGGTVFESAVPSNTAERLGIER